MVHCGSKHYNTFYTCHQGKAMIQKMLPMCLPHMCVLSWCFWSYLLSILVFLSTCFCQVRVQLNPWTYSNKFLSTNQATYPSYASYTSQQEQILGCRKLTDSSGERDTHANNYNNIMAQRKYIQDTYLATVESNNCLRRDCVSKDSKNPDGS